jgi:hypothetical protein
MEDGELPDGLIGSVAEYLKNLEEVISKHLGDSAGSLLVSVRAVASMPGMMDTVLNLGLR